MLQNAKNTRCESLRHKDSSWILLLILRNTLPCATMWPATLGAAEVLNRWRCVDTRSDWIGIEGKGKVRCCYSARIRSAEHTSCFRAGCLEGTHRGSIRPEQLQQTCTLQVKGFRQRRREEDRPQKRSQQSSCPCHSLVGPMGESDSACFAPTDGWPAGVAPQRTCLYETHCGKRRCGRYLTAGISTHWAPLPSIQSKPLNTVCMPQRSQQWLNQFPKLVCQFPTARDPSPQRCHEQRPFRRILSGRNVYEMDSTH